MNPQQLQIQHTNESGGLDDLLDRRKQCAAELSRTEIDITVNQHSDALHAYLVGVRAALALLDRKIAFAKKTQRSHELMDVAKKMVLTTANWYEQLNQIKISSQQPKTAQAPVKNFLSW